MRRGEKGLVGGGREVVGSGLAREVKQLPALGGEGQTRRQRISVRSWYRYTFYRNRAKRRLLVFVYKICYSYCSVMNCSHCIQCITSVWISLNEKHLDLSTADHFLMLWQFDRPSCKLLYIMYCGLDGEWSDILDSLCAWMRFSREISCAGAMSWSVKLRRPELT